MTHPYLFILNPNSGTSIGRNSIAVREKIHSVAKKYAGTAQVLFTEEPAHATELVSKHMHSEKWKAIVAVGGDGTVNEIGKPLVGSGIPLGILPLGSGNGLARHLGLPLTLDAALTRLFEGKAATIDSAELNGIPFFCTAGMGFDAYVGHLFSKQKARGLATYVKVSFRAYWSYKPQPFKLNGANMRAFSLSFANAGQFGNNAWVAPQASLQDGLLDICTIKPFPQWYGTALAYGLFTKQLKQSRFIDYERATRAVVETETPPMIHYDGEPMQLDTNRIEVIIKPGSLHVIL